MEVIFTAFGLFLGLIFILWLIYDESYPFYFKFIITLFCFTIVNTAYMICGEDVINWWIIAGLWIVVLVWGTIASMMTTARTNKEHKEYWENKHKEIKELDKEFDKQRNDVLIH